MHTLPSGPGWWFEQLDEMRRRRGAAMERMGYGPVETPSDVVLSIAGLRLRRYGATSRNDATSRSEDIALIVPAPIKRHYIWDLAPESSVVQRVLASGMQAWLIEWRDPTESEENFGFEEYGYILIEACVRALRQQNPSGRLFLLGHSLGGLLAAIYTALAGERVDGLVLIEAPLHFPRDAGAFVPLLALGTPRGSVAQLFGRVPGSVLSMTSALASPSTFQFERGADFVACLGSRKHMRTHLQVERWTLDEAPMPGRLFEQVVEQLYREDQFMRGSLSVAGRRIGPALLKTPLLAVYDPKSVVIPPDSILRFHEAAASIRKRTLVYEGDRGIAINHVGALMGERAQAHLWPDILGWLQETAAPRH